MKEITLQIEDDHYGVFWYFAQLYGMPVGEYVLMAAKCTASAALAAQDEGDEVVHSCDIDRRLGGDG